MRQRNILLLLISIMFVASTAGCIYHKPEFIGQILDKETKQPIESAVVVAVYNKEVMGIGAGANTKIINMRETLTDRNGQFRIPSYTTLIVPIFTRESNATFVIFKPGYASLSGMHLENHFASEKGKEEELKLFYTTETIRLFPHGIVELPKIKTREEREKARMSATFWDFDDIKKKLPLMYRAIDEERKSGF